MKLLSKLIDAMKGALGDYVESKVADGEVLKEKAEKMLKDFFSNTTFKLSYNPETGKVELEAEEKK